MFIMNVLFFANVTGDQGDQNQTLILNMLTNALECYLNMEIHYLMDGRKCTIQERGDIFTGVLEQIEYPGSLQGIQKQR